MKQASLKFWLLVITSFFFGFILSSCGPQAAMNSDDYREGRPNNQTGFFFGGNGYTVDGDEIRTQQGTEEMLTTEGDEYLSAEERQQLNIDLATSVTGVSMIRYNSEGTAEIIGTDSIRFEIQSLDSEAPDTLVFESPLELNDDYSRREVHIVRSTNNPRFKIFGALSDIYGGEKVYGSFYLVKMSSTEEDAYVEATTKINLRSYIGSVNIRTQYGSNLRTHEGTSQHIARIESSIAWVNDFHVILGRSFFEYDFLNIPIQEREEDQLTRLLFAFTGESVDTSEIDTLDVNPRNGEITTGLQNTSSDTPDRVVNPRLWGAREEVGGRTFVIDIQRADGELEEAMMVVDEIAPLDDETQQLILRPSQLTAESLTPVPAEPVEAVPPAEVLEPVETDEEPAAAFEPTQQPVVRSGAQPEEDEEQTGTVFEPTQQPVVRRGPDPGEEPEEETAGVLFEPTQTPIVRAGEEPEEERVVRTTPTPRPIAPLQVQPQNEDAARIAFEQAILRAREQAIAEQAQQAAINAAIEEAAALAESAGDPTIDVEEGNVEAGPTVNPSPAIAVVQPNDTHETNQATFSRGIGDQPFLPVPFDTARLPRTAAGLMQIETYKNKSYVIAQINRMHRFRDFRHARIYGSAFVPMINAAFQHWDVVPNLIYRMIFESNFLETPNYPTRETPSANSPWSAALGPGQFLLSTATGRTVRMTGEERTLFGPVVCGMAKYMGYFQHLFPHDGALAYLAYHSGEGSGRSNSQNFAGVRGYAASAFGQEARARSYRLTYHNLRAQNVINDHQQEFADMSIALNFIMQSPIRYNASMPAAGSIWSTSRVAEATRGKVFPTGRIHDPACEQAIGSFRSTFQ